MEAVLGRPALPLGTMAPKRGGVLARPAAKVRPARPAAKAKVRPGRAAAKVMPVMRRPAGRRDRGRGGTPTEKWEKGEEAPLRDLDPREVVKAKWIVCERATYYHQECQVAGKVTGIVLEDNASYLTVHPSGTDSDALLQFHTGHPNQALKAHVCPADCNHEEVGDTIIHMDLVRKMGEPGQEEGWTKNLERVAPDPGYDELGALRARERDATGPSGVGDAPGKKEEADTKAKKKDKKEKKRKKKEEAESETDEIKVDGSNAKGAGVKRVKALFSGTGLDPKEKIRNKVTKKARRYVKKKAAHSSSSSSGKSGSKSEASETGEAATLFGESSSVKDTAKNYPGVLTSQTLEQMRQGLIQEIGMEDTSGKVAPVCIAYFRQSLMRKATGPSSRELLTLCTALDHLIRGRAAAACDVMVQRIKSIEQSLTGTHWSVATRQELLPQENMTLSTEAEVKAARKESYQDSKTRWAAAFPDGRVPRNMTNPQGNKNDGNQKGKGKGQGKDKNKGGKGDGKKQKDGGGKPDQ